MRLRVPVGVCVALIAACVAAQPARAEPFPAHRRQVANTSITWRLPAARLDQDRRDTCGIFAALQQLDMAGAARIDQKTANRISDAAQAITVSATYGSNDALRDVLARSGYRVTYRAVGGGVDGLLAALRSGPVELDVPFYAGMYETTASGQWRPTGPYLYLGHGVVAYGRVGDRILVLNQWGTWWGIDGTAWITVADLRRLAAEHPDTMSATRWDWIRRT